MSAPNNDSIWWEVEFGWHSAGNWMTTGGHYGGLIADTWQQVLKNVAESRGVPTEKVEKVFIQRHEEERPLGEWAPS